MTMRETRHPSDGGHEAEFDAYAATYESGMDHAARRCLGGDSESFIEVKVDWFQWRFGKFQQNDGMADVRLLDYGCGTGSLLRVLRRQGFRGDLAGCDVSREMLLAAETLWRQGPLPQLGAMNNMLAPFDDGSFDFVVVSSVLHHVALDQRERAYADILRLLKPGGCVCIFEHNPYNPVTQWVVRHTPIDKNAVLLRPGEVRRGVAKVGGLPEKTRYIMFSPPRLRFLRPLDRAFWWFPLGAQYVICAIR